ncbi:MAG: lysine--tRNA ligase [Chloroflexi bacterium]|nr:lysine--tRNA ligase [Chloroflexota bacterium]
MNGTEDRLIAQRRAKLAEVDEPYPDGFKPTHRLAEAVAEWDEQGELGHCRVAGRLTRISSFGGGAFADIDSEGTRLQLLLSRKVLGPDSYSATLDWADVGDVVGVEGEMFLTRTGQATLRVAGIQLLAKALRPLPEKYHGLRDVETRYRRRHLDLIANEDSRRIFKTRTRVISQVRAFLDGRGFLEVETPTLQPVYGGAAAQPFTTHYNALDREYYLRISDELYLKRLIVGGFERVYEICKDFRNEGIDRTHGPEFTMLECYQAFADYNDVMELTELMVAEAANAVNGSAVIHGGEISDSIDLSPPWPRIKFREAVLDATGLDIEEFDDAHSLAAAVRTSRVDADPEQGIGKVYDKILDQAIVPGISNPVFIYDYPLEFAPLAKRVPGSDRYVAKVEAFVRGMEIANGYSELTDPIEQRRRFEDQYGGDPDAQPVDEEFIAALEQGMPPTGGLGVGIDRLVMLVTGARHFREVVLFPQLRSDPQ